MPSSKPRYGVQIKTEGRCKICTHEQRGEIEDLFARASRGEKDDDGVRITQDYVCERSPTLFGMRLNRANVNSHLKRHFRIGDPETLQEQRVGGLIALHQAVADGRATATTEDFLAKVIGIAAVKADLDPNSVTIDHGLKAVAELTKRKQNEAASQLLAGLGAAIGASVRRDPLPEPSIPGEAEEIAEAEVVAGAAP